MIVFLLTANAFSQTPDSNVVVPVNSVLTGFDQNLNTLTWNGLAGANLSSNAYGVKMDENFHSVLIAGQQNLIRDEQSVDFQLTRSLFGNISGLGLVQSNYFSDSRQIGLNSVGASTVLGGLTYATRRDTLAAAVGNKWDRQAGVENIGITYDAHGSSILSPLDGSLLLPSLMIHDEEISPRRNFDRAAGVIYRQVFSPGSSVNFQGTYTTQLRDFFFPADPVVEALYNVTNNIQSRNEDRENFLAGLSTPFAFFQLNSQVSLGERSIDLTYRYKPTIDTANTLYDTRIRVSDFDFLGQVLTNFLEDTLLVSMEHSERDETHSVINARLVDPFTAIRDSNEAQLNSLEARNTLTGKFLLHFGSFSANLSGLASLLRYDTPSDLNFDDRDELTNTLSLQVMNEFSPFFQAGVGAEGDLIHVVYITSERSANNNRNFIYKLFPIVIYSGSTVNSYNRFEVLANYTVYDYEAFSEVHSFSFRQASFLDSTRVALTSKVSAFLLASVKLYTRGELYWSSFSEYPLNYFVDQTFWLYLSYFTGNVGYGVGYKYLSLTRYDYTTATERNFALRQTNAGPTGFFTVEMEHVRIFINGWYQVSTQSLENAIVYPNFELKASYIF